MKYDIDACVTFSSSSVDDVDVCNENCPICPKTMTRNISSGLCAKFKVKSMCGIMTLLDCVAK